jgi:hypothetical protein
MTKKKHNDFEVLVEMAEELDKKHWLVHVQVGNAIEGLLPKLKDVDFSTRLMAIQTLEKIAKGLKTAGK